MNVISRSSRTLHSLSKLRFLCLWNQKKLRVIYFILLLFISSCTEPFRVEIPSSSQKLVVEGFIDQTNADHFVKLSTSTDFNGIGFNTLGQGAEVSILYSNGTVIPYAEIDNADGLYLLQGQLAIDPTDSIKLLIELSNGDIYESTYQQLPPKITLDSSEAILKGVTDSFGDSSFFHDIKLHFSNDESHFYAVDNIGYARVPVNYELELPDPFLPIRCWSIRNPISNAQIILGNNLGLRGDSYAETILSIPVDAKDQYIAQLYIRSMSIENFSLFRDINDQLRRNGSLYDRDIAPVIGNITQSNGSKIALGYFHFYHTTEEVICFSRENVKTGVIIPIIPPTLYCIDYWAPATYDDLSFLFCN